MFTAIALNHNIVQIFWAEKRGHIWCKLSWEMLDFCQLCRQDEEWLCFWVIASLGFLSRNKSLAVSPVLIHHRHSQSTLWLILALNKSHQSSVSFLLSVCKSEEKELAAFAVTGVTNCLGVFSSLASFPLNQTKKCAYPKLLFLGQKRNAFLF